MRDRKIDISKLTPLAKRFVIENNYNETDIFKAWKWDAIIHAIETGQLTEKDLKEKNYI